MTITMRFGERLRALREERGWGLREASRKLSLSTTAYLGDVERGAFLPKDDRLDQISQVYGVSRRTLDDWIVGDHLMTKTGEKSPGVSFFLRSLDGLDERAQRQAIKVLLTRLAKRQDAGEPWPDEFEVRPRGGGS